MTTGLVAVGPAGLAESRYSLRKRDPSSLTGEFHQLLLMNGVAQRIFSGIESSACSTRTASLPAASSSSTEYIVIVS